MAEYKNIKVPIKLRNVRFLYDVEKTEEEERKWMNF
jgi:hypothetical protein